MFLLNGQPLAVDVPFATDDGTQYAATFLRLSTPEQKAAIGITEAPDPTPVDTRFYWSEGNPRDLHQLIEQHIAQVKQAAASQLQPTDWKIIREVEGGSPAGAELKAWRKAVRDESDVKVAAINGAATVEALIAVVSAADFLAWPEFAEAPKKDPATSTKRAAGK
jgi:hypothetical protein